MEGGLEAKINEGFVHPVLITCFYPLPRSQLLSSPLPNIGSYISTNPLRIPASFILLLESYLSLKHLPVNALG